MSALGAPVRHLLDEAVQAWRGATGEDDVRRLRARLDEPLRLALAGRVKAGKSTLLNALVGQELAPTDAGECTRIVTWYRHGITYRVDLEPVEGQAVQAPFTRDGGPLEIDLGGRHPDEVRRLTVAWPSRTLDELTLVDTPGLGSATVTTSERTVRFLTEADGADEVDAVCYLLRHVHAEDVRFLEAFHDDDLAHATPVNAVGVLSRADEVGVARLDALDSARRIAARWSADARLRRLCQEVVPVAGLVAQAGATLVEDEHRALATLAAQPAEALDALLLSADRFTADEAGPPEVVPLVRRHLLDRLGLFGVRLSIDLLRRGEATGSTELARALLDRSGIGELRRLLSSRFAARAQVLKARTALAGLDDLLLRRPPPAGGERLAAEVEALTASAHELAELRLLSALRTDAVALKDVDRVRAERLLEETDVAARLGAPADADVEALRSAVAEELARWQRRAESPMAPPEVAAAARTLCRTCEGMLAALV